MTNSVAKPSDQSMRGDPKLQKIRTLRAGNEAMRQAGETYLPKEERETQKDYEDRVKRSWLFPALDKAIEDVADRVFSKEVQFGEDMPTDLQDLAENIDMEGRDLNSFARDVFEDGVEAGISYILVDSPRKEEGMTRADAIAENFRPYLVHIKAEDILGWKTATVGNQTVLTQVRIMESQTEDDPDDEFAQVSVEQVRVLTLDGTVSVRIYRKDEQKGAWALHDEFFTDMTEITLVPFYTNRTGFMTATPRYEKLADLNIAHWQSASDQRHILHTARVPLLMFFGFTPGGGEGEEKTAANSAIATDTSKTEADAKWVEIEGAGIEAGERDLEKLEQRMQVLGIELMVKPTSNTGATGAVLDHGKVTTPLAMMANSLKDALEISFRFLAKYMGRDDAGSVSVNTDFGLGSITNADLTFLLNAVNTGQISHETFLKELIRRGVLMDLDPEEEADKIKDEAPGEVSMPGLDEEDDEPVNIGAEFLKVVNGGK